MFKFIKQWFKKVFGKKAYEGDDPKRVSLAGLQTSDTEAADETYALEGNGAAPADMIDYTFAYDHLTARVQAYRHGECIPSEDWTVLNRDALFLLDPSNVMIIANIERVNNHVYVLAAGMDPRVEDNWNVYSVFGYCHPLPRTKLSEFPRLLDIPSDAGRVQFVTGKEMVDAYSKPSTLTSDCRTIESLGTITNLKLTFDKPTYIYNIRRALVECIGPDGVIDASHSFVGVKSALLRLPRKDNLHIVGVGDVLNCVFVIQPGADPAFPSNWECKSYAMAKNKIPAGLPCFTVATREGLLQLQGNDTLDTIAKVVDADTYHVLAAGADSSNPDNWLRASTTYTDVEYKHWLANNPQIVLDESIRFNPDVKSILDIDVGQDYRSGKSVIQRPADQALKDDEYVHRRAQLRDRMLSVGEIIDQAKKETSSEPTLKSGLSGVNSELEIKDVQLRGSSAEMHRVLAQLLAGKHNKRTLKKKVLDRYTLDQLRAERVKIDEYMKSSWCVNRKAALKRFNVIDTIISRIQ